MAEPSIKNSKILITGGAGFIGSNLAEALIKDNEIVVVDDLSMGKKENLPQGANLHFIEHSIADYDFMSTLLETWKFDYIFLLAAVASVADTIVRPAETHIINQDANLNVLETIRTNKLPVKKILFSSSAAVYGNNPELPKKETSPIDPLSPYAVDKFATERFVIDYGRLYDIPTVATRFFNVYGPKQNPKSPYSGVLSLILAAIKSGSEFHFYGDGNQTRDFVFIKDVVSALIILMCSDDAMYDVFNVATGQSNSLINVSGIFENITGEKLIATFGPMRTGDIRDSLADISKLRELGYLPKYSIEEGLSEYYQNN
ncbi:NAD-dependent epimerase/dehydratase family protein [Lacticaseibacillus pantheris]|uniref:NAD-dependent epimerase/dehydratase family protein n=1 Tax=Lacticaseibacillus pantheris TaxID=171523 RepID=UPI002658B93E|nr:NAD-dependent epimerase/dehydratase family protein [Lacticaseibacillus pantheris]WKF84151.1 GDP-mannose 4,6-dehydratase [Lacticaseibacillus pantheris]